jgi:hypothetical protein
MKKRLLVLILCTVSLFAFAPEKTLKVELSVQEWEYVLNTLQDKPKKEVDPLFNKILSQLQTQLVDSTKKK